MRRIRRLEHTNKKLVRIENLRYEEKYGSKYYCMTVVDEDEAEK